MTSDQPRPGDEPGDRGPEPQLEWSLEDSLRLGLPRSTEEGFEEGFDPALAAAVLEIENHVADAGWDQPARLYALVDTAELVAAEPALASLMGLDDASQEGSLTPIEQDELAPDQRLEEVLQTTAWPDSVTGCAAVVERLVLPPEADADIPEDPVAAAEFASRHPDRQEVRMIAGVTRAGATYCALRLRSHDDDQSVVAGADLVPQLLQLLRATLEDPLDGRPAPGPDTPEDTPR